MTVSNRRFWIASLRYALVNVVATIIASEITNSSTFLRASSISLISVWNARIRSFSSLLSDFRFSTSAPSISVWAFWYAALIASNIFRIGPRPSTVKPISRKARSRELTNWFNSWLCAAYCRCRLSIWAFVYLVSFWYSAYWAKTSSGRAEYFSLNSSSPVIVSAWASWDASK